MFGMDLESIRKHLKRGDRELIAQAAKVKRRTVYAVLLGERYNDQVITHAIRVAKKRKAMRERIKQESKNLEK